MDVEKLPITCGEPTSVQTCHHPFFFAAPEPQKQRFIPGRGFTTRVVNLYSFPTQATQSRLTTRPGEKSRSNFFFGSGSFLVASCWWLMVANASLKMT